MKTFDYLCRAVENLPPLENYVEPIKDVKLIPMQPLLDLADPDTSLAARQWYYEHFRLPFPSVILDHEECCWWVWNPDRDREPPLGASVPRNVLYFQLMNPRQAVLILGAARVTEVGDLNDEDTIEVQCHFGVLLDPEGRGPFKFQPRVPDKLLDIYVDQAALALGALAVFTNPQIAVQVTPPRRQPKPGDIPRSYERPIYRPVQN